MHRAQEIHAAGLRAMALLALVGGPFVACAWAAQPATALGGRTSERSETGGGVAPTGGAAGAGGVSVVDSGGAGGGGSGGARGGTSGSPGDGGSRSGGSASGGTRAAGGSSAGGASGGSGGGGGTLTNPGVRPSAGCGLPGASGRQDLTVNIRGTRRSYRVQFPTPYVPNASLPLIFYFHWQDGTVNDVVALPEPAVWNVGNAAKEAAFVWPQGLIQPDGQSGWNVTCGGEDVEFFDAILSQLSADRCLDLNRVFSTGFSFGAEMSNTLACCRGRDVIRAVAPASGTALTPNQTCAAAKLPPVRFSYGTKDTAYTQKSFQDVVAFYRAKQGCSADYDSVPVAPCGATWTDDGSTVTCACRSYRNCERPVVECTFTNMPHTTAAGWREDTWAFFSGFGAEK